VSSGARSTGAGAGGGLPLIAAVLLASACAGGGAEPTTAPAEPPPTAAPPTAGATSAPACPDAFCVVYHIHADAVWSDGAPVVADDFIFTSELAAESAGRELMTGAERMGPKTALFSFSEPYGAWRTLLPTVLPRHVLEGTSLSDDPAKALRTTAGPFVLDSWDEGDQITLRRNRRYWAEADRLSGEPLGDVQEIRFVFPASVEEALRGLEAGEIDVVIPRPLAAHVAEIEEMEGVSRELAPGPFWEHIDFNHDDPLLSQRWAREVVNLAVDREAILDQTVRRAHPGATALGNTFWPPGAARYEDHFEDRFDPEAAEKILADRLCVKGEDGVYLCQGRRMSFTWAVTAGDEDRETVFDIVSESLESIGVELVPRVVAPSDLFSSEVGFAGPEVWQIVSFAWKGAADPNLSSSAYICSGDAPSGFGALNLNRYCDETVDSLIRGADSIIDPDERAAAYNAADEAYLGDLAIIPLYRKPVLMAWDGSLRGPRPNSSRSTELWNTAAWAGKETVVIALESEPELSSPLAAPEPDLARVLAPLLHGAFGATPELAPVPVLVDGVEILSGGG